MQLPSVLRSFLVLTVLLGSSGVGNAENSQLLNRFGKWSLQKLGDFIILAPTDDRIMFGCSDSMMVYQITLPISDRSAVVWNDAFKAHYFHFTAWADAGKPVDFRLYVFDKDAKAASAMATLNPEINTQDTALWALIKSARVKFAYSTAAGTIDVDATDLAPAISRFEEECAKVFIANAHRKLKEPIPQSWLNR